MKPIPITARQIKEFDEIVADQDANKRTLEVAMRFHSNIENELYKRLKALWDELIEIYGLDVNKTTYQIKHVDGLPCIVKQDVD